MNKTGVALSISAAMCSSTAESAPKLETSAIRPGKSSAITARINSGVSIPANSTSSRAAFSAAPRMAASFMAIKSLLERSHANPPVGGKKILCRARAELQIGIDDGLDRVDDLLGRKTAPGERADIASLVGGAAERQLIGLRPGLLQSENADMADMMMSAGINAAGNIDLELADVPRPRAIAEPLRNTLRDGNRARCRKRAIIEAGAGNNVGDKPRIGGGKTMAGEPIEQLRQIIERDMRQNEILFMRDADLVC